jgi:hypothetical protein
VTFEPKSVYLGTFQNAESAPKEAALGVFYLMESGHREGYYVRAWTENFGPFTTRERADGEYWEILRKGQGVTFDSLGTPPMFTKWGLIVILLVIFLALLIPVWPTLSTAF